MNDISVIIQEKDILIMTKKPKYQEIYDYYQKAITNHKLKVGEALPSEEEIIKKFSTSHMTVNKAMVLLSTDGYIQRIPGNGTFVCDDYKKTLQSSPYQFEGLNQTIARSGMKPRTVLVSYQIKTGEQIPEIARLMNIANNEYIHEIIRLKYGNDRFVCLTKAHLSQKILPAIDITKLEGSLDDYIHSAGIFKTDGTTILEACLPNAEDKKYFGDKDVALLHQRIIWNIEGEAFEVSDNYFLGSMISIKNPRHIEINSD